ADNQKNKSSKPALDPVRLLHLRADNRSTVEVEGKEVELKTAAVLCPSPLGFEPVQWHLIQNRFTEHQKSIKTNRPSDQVLRSPGGTPQAVITPGKSQLTLVSNYGPFCTFSNARKLVFESPKKSVPPTFASSSPAAAVKKNALHTKHVKAFISQESLKRAHREIEANAGQRQCSQNAVMAVTSSLATQASATQYAKAAQLASEGQRWEWLHLIAHFILANKAQNEANLGAGTYHANTEMLSIEIALKALVVLFPAGFWLEVKAHFIPDTQLLTTIEYNINLGSCVLPFVFNAQQKNQPSIYTLSYVDALVHTLRDIHADIDSLDSFKKKLDFELLEAEGEKENISPGALNAMKPKL
ncbi:MAG TPA: hypothetical protein VLH77_02045, partial [Gammaproteobacteria bacterium]|nr:hypothetical protein [Gammaproteobacteria bacterium]